MCISLFFLFLSSAFSFLFIITRDRLQVRLAGMEHLIHSELAAFSSVITRFAVLVHTSHKICMSTMHQGDTPSIQKDYQHCGETLCSLTLKSASGALFVNKIISNYVEMITIMHF